LIGGRKAREAWRLATSQGPRSLFSPSPTDAYTAREIAAGDQLILEFQNSLEHTLQASWSHRRLLRTFKMCREKPPKQKKPNTPPKKKKTNKHHNPQTTNNPTHQSKKKLENGAAHQKRRGSRHWGGNREKEKRNRQGSAISGPYERTLWGPDLSILDADGASRRTVKGRKGKKAGGEGKWQGVVF